MSLRPIKRLIKAKPTLEGAGVHLRRAFGFGNTSDFDPFLLLDDFRNERPEDYLAGFPWHPHRGIETITHVCPRGNRRARRQHREPRRHRRRRRPMDDGGERDHPPGDAEG
jgi:redox-sensitive bicupin YhaK (pirin superfamily)